MTDALTATRRDEPPSRILTRKRYGDGIAGAIVALVAAMVLRSAITNENFAWPTFGRYVFSPAILDGVVRTIELAVVVMALSIVLGVALAIMRQSSNTVLNATAVAYIWLFRATPLLVLLLMLYNFAALYPQLSLGVPFGPDL